MSRNSRGVRRGRSAHIGSSGCHDRMGRRFRESGTLRSMTQRSGPQFWVGTSGYNYAEWKGSFYPEKFSSKNMLPFYAERLPTVEIN